MNFADRLAAIKEHRRNYPSSPRVISPEDADWLVGEVEQLRVLVTYREQTIDKLKAELERNSQAFQRLIPDAERTEELEREVTRLRGLLRRLEWAAGICPACLVLPNPDRHLTGVSHHDRDCWLAEALGLPTASLRVTNVLKQDT